MSEHRQDALQLRYAPEASTPRAVRREFAQRFDAHPCLETMLLCLSEVVTNAVLHARTDLSVSVLDLGDRVRVEVGDGSLEKPTRRTFAEISPTGRGLHLLERLATAWGVEMKAHGKVVWFEIGWEPKP